MTELTQQQMALSRNAGSAVMIHEAKMKEHEAACMAACGIEEARYRVLAATEAMLDARERLYREMFQK